LTATPTYRGQLVRLAACEKGCKWKHFLMDVVKGMTNLEPWYVKLNPKAYVPTMLVGVENTPICESANIMNYIDREFEGTCKL